MPIKAQDDHYFTDFRKGGCKNDVKTEVRYWKESESTTESSLRINH